MLQIGNKTKTLSTLIYFVISPIAKQRRLIMINEKRLWKQYWKKGVLFLALCFLYCGCGQEEPVTQGEESSVITINGISTMPTGTSYKVKATPTPIQEPTGYPINMDIAIDTDACNGMNRKFTRDMESGASLFCLDEDETIYFVNQNRDNYLYELKDGIVQLAVAMPVKEVYVWEDSVYFMVKEDIEGKKAGDIYRYQKETKELELVYAVGTIQGGQNHKLSVNAQGVHFNYSDIVSKEGDITRVMVSYYTLPFGESEPRKDTKNQGKAGWGDYYFSYSLTEDSTQPAKVALVSRTNEAEDSISINIGDFQYCVANDTIYSMQLGSCVISTFNLKTQSRKVYNVKSDIAYENNYVKNEMESCFGEGIEEFSYFTMTENGNIIWFTDGEYLYRMERRSDGYVIVKAMTTTDRYGEIGQLYTDGRRVYGLYSSDGTKESSLVRFCVETIKEEYYFVQSDLTIAVEYLVPEEGDVVGVIPKPAFCIEHVMQIKNEESYSFTEDHLYFCGEIKKEEGSEEQVYQDCTITTNVETYEKGCELCNLTAVRLGCGEKRRHSTCGFVE